MRGEGIVVRFPEQRIAAWEARYRASDTAVALWQAHRGWRGRRGLTPEEGWPGERYVLLHSFAHALIRELALECGYTASSIREPSTPATGPTAATRWRACCSTPPRPTARERWAAW